MTLTILLGPPGAGKTAWAKDHFTPTEIVNSDCLRWLVTDDPLNVAHDDHVWRLYFQLVEARLAAGRDVCCDGGATVYRHRCTMQSLARRYGATIDLVILDVPLDVCIERDRTRNRTVGARVIQSVYPVYEFVRDHAPRGGYDRIITVPFTGTQRLPHKETS